MESSEYESAEPSVYKVKAWMQVCFLLVAAVYFVFSYKTVEYLRQQFTGPGWIMIAVEAFLLAFGLLIVVHVFVSRVELDRDSVTYRGVLGRRSIPRTAVAGIKTVDGEGARNVVLISEQPGVRNLAIPLLYDFDQRWTGWVATLKKVAPERSFGSRKA